MSKELLECEKELIKVIESKGFFGRKKTTIYVSLNILFGVVTRPYNSWDDILTMNFGNTSTGRVHFIQRTLLYRNSNQTNSIYCNEKWTFDGGYLTVPDAIKVLQTGKSLRYNTERIDKCEEELKIALLQHGLYNKYYDTAIHKKHKTTIRIFNVVIW